MTECLIFG